MTKTYKPCPLCGVGHHHFAHCKPEDVDANPDVEITVGGKPVSLGLFAPDRVNVRGDLAADRTNQFSRSGFKSADQSVARGYRL